MGADGSLPTGTPPDIYLSGELSNWTSGYNLGTGPSFNLVGTLTECGTSPQLPARTPDVTKAADFGGATYLTTSVAGTVTSKTGTMSFWFKTDADPSVAYYPVCMGSSQFFGVSWGKDGGVLYEWYSLFSGEGQFVYRARSAATVAGKREWRHVLMSWDLNATTVHVYVNDVVPSLSVLVAPQNTATGWSGSAWAIGATASSSFHLNGCMSEVYASREYLDVSVEANRRKFVSASGAPVSLGADGSLPTGSQPDIYLSGPSSNWASGMNFGSGPAFTVVGAVTECGTSPQL
eukprot:scaffold19421_cov30-Prasinocladus_malaysianus.AAC.3